MLNNFFFPKAFFLFLIHTSFFELSLHAIFPTSLGQERGHEAYPRGKGQSFSALQRALTIQVSDHEARASNVKAVWNRSSQTPRSSSLASVCRMWEGTELAVPSGLRESVIVQKPSDKLSWSSNKNSTQRQLIAGLGILDQRREGMQGDGGEHGEQGMQLEGFRRAVLSLICTANCLTSFLVDFFPCMCSQYHHQSLKQKCLGMSIWSSGCSQQIWKGVGTPS